MITEILFGITLTTLFIYCVLGNYIYLCKVMPELSDESCSGMPSVQRAQFDRYYERLKSRNESLWFMPFIVYKKPIAACQLLLLLVTVTFAYFE